MTAEAGLCGRQFSTAADFLHVSDSEVLALASYGADPTLRKMADDLTLRRLPKRSCVFRPNRTPVSEQIEHLFRTKPYNVSLETEHQLAHH